MNCIDLLIDWIFNKLDERALLKLYYKYMADEITYEEYKEAKILQETKIKERDS